MTGRRGVLGFVLAAPLTLAGCSGWTPLYADRETGPADTELAAIRVDPILERIGQRLELGLRQTLNPTGIQVAKRYALRTRLTVARQDLGVQTQGYGTRGKLDVTATFELVDTNSGTSLLSNSIHVADAFDIVANEYSSVVAEDDARARTAEELRREIVARLTLFMQRRLAAKA
jgi:LPS-assembly lipoprotein